MDDDDRDYGLAYLEDAAPVDDDQEDNVDPWIKGFTNMNDLYLAQEGRGEI